MIKIYDTRDAVPEAQRATAIETKEGKFAAEEDLGDAGKKALQQERDRADKAEKERKAAEKERDELKLKAEAASKGITEAQLEEIRKKEAESRKPIEEERDRVKAENRKLKLDDRVRALGLKYGWMPDRVEKAMKDLHGRVDLTEDEKSIVVKDAAGNLTTESIDDFLKTTYKKEASFFYAGAGGAGSGSEGSGGGGGDDAIADAVKAGKAAAAVQKHGREENKLAFT